MAARSAMRRKAKLVVDISALPHNHFHVLFPAATDDLGFNFKDQTGNHWPQIVNVEDDGLAHALEPLIAVGCEVISINGTPVVGLAFQQAQPLLAKRPAEFVFCEPLDHIEPAGERRALPAALATAAMRVERGETVGRTYATEDPYNVEDDFFGFDGDAADMTSTYDDPNPVGHVENPMSSSTDAFQAAAAAVEVGEKFVNPVSGRTLRKKDKGAERDGGRPQRRETAAAVGATFDVEERTVGRQERTKKEKSTRHLKDHWKPYNGEGEKNDDMELGYMDTDDIMGDDIIGNVAMGNPGGGGRIKLGDDDVSVSASSGEVNGINMYTRRQKHHRNVVRGVSCCLGVLIVYWVSLMSAQAAATYEHECTYDGGPNDCMQRESGFQTSWSVMHDNPEPEPEPMVVELCDRPTYGRCQSGCSYIPAANGLTFICIPTQNWDEHYGSEPPLIYQSGSPEPEPEPEPVAVG